MAEPVLNEELYKDIEEFLKDSSDHYSADNQRAKHDLEFFSGNQWGDQPYFARGGNRVMMTLSELPKYVGAIQSAAVKSPYHNEVTYEVNDGRDIKELSGIQGQIDRIEAQNSYKTVLMKTLYQDIITGIGACDLTTVLGKDGVTTEIVIEHIRDVATIAWDANSEEDSMADAEQCAIVTWMSKRKAGRKYGAEVCDLHPDEMKFGTQFRQDTNDDSHVPVVTYYEKQDDGVHIHKLVGKYEVEPETVLNISHIPVFKMSGYPVLRDGKFVSVGIVDRVKELQVGVNLAWSTMIERLNRSVKAGYICEIEAIEGLQDQISKLSSGDIPLFLYKKGFNKPEQITEQFAVQDLQQVITSSQNLISSTIGVPTAGVSGTSSIEKTATQSLLEQENSESNVAIFYQSLSEVSRLIGLTVCELLQGTTDLPYIVKVVNGPEVITRNSRRRIELNNMAGMVPDSLKPIVAKYYAETLDDSIGADLAANITANLDPSVKLVEQSQDPNTLHVQQQAKFMIDQQQEIIQKLQQEKSQLEQENQTLNLSIIDNREARSVDLAKALMENERQAAKDRAEIALKSAEVALQYESDVRDSNLKAAAMVQDAVRENNDVITEELGRVPAGIAKSPVGFNVPDGSWNEQ